MGWVFCNLAEIHLKTSDGLNWENKTFKVKRSTFKFQKYMYVIRPFYTGVCLSPGFLILAPVCNHAEQIHFTIAVLNAATVFLNS